MEDGVIVFLRGLVGTKEIWYSIKDIIIQDPSLDYVGYIFDRIGSFHIFFCIVLFYPILGHNLEPRLFLRYPHEKSKGVSVPNCGQE